MRQQAYRFAAPLLVAATAFAFSAATPAQAKPKSITIGSNPAGSAYFLLAGGFAKLFQEKLAHPLDRAAACRLLGLSATAGQGRDHAGDEFEPRFRPRL